MTKQVQSKPDRQRKELNVTVTEETLTRAENVMGFFAILHLVAKGYNWFNS